MQILGTITDDCKVSVISGFYNRAGVAERTIASLLNQTAKDYQIVVFDDASTDNSREVMTALHARYHNPRLVVILHERNMGFVNGLIDAMARVQTPYVAIQGSGDISFPERLALQSAVLDTDEEIGAVGCWYEVLSEDENRIRAIRPAAERSTVQSLQKDAVFAHGDVMFRRTAYDAAGGYRPVFKMAMDRDLWIRMRAVSRFYTVPKVLYRKYGLRDGISYDPKKMVLQARYKALAIRLSQLEGKAQRALYAKTERDGIEAAIPITDPIVQRYVNWGVMRLIGQGYWTPGTDLRPYIVSPLRRLFLTISGRILNHPRLFWVRRLAQRMFDMNEQAPHETQTPTSRELEI